MQQHIGKRLGAYQIVEQIGQGGMATVFKAYQPSVDRYVAIKILPNRFAEDESFVGRFTQEARTLARLEHSHILPVHDYGEEEGTTYLVMRYVKAGTLKDLIAREGPMELKEAARILGQVGRALDYAHSQGVVHRDIKPSNILIDQQGNTFLTDFGIAKLVAETAQFTASGAIIGTPAYMAPEQSMGRPVDYLCDIYSLGVVLYEMVTGRVPFEAETPLAVLLKHINDPLPMPRQTRPDLPERVELVILKAMAKVPEDRFESAQDMVDALAEAVAAPPTEIAEPPLPAQPADATTLARSKGELLPAAEITPPPAIDTAPPPAAKTAPPPPLAKDVAPPPDLDTTPPPAADSTPPRLEAVATARRRIPWMYLAGGAVLVVLVVAVGQFAVRNLTGGGATPTVVSQVEATPSAVSQVEAAPTAESPPATVPSAAVPAQAQLSPGWTNYGNGNFVSTVARQGDTLWAGGESGLVRWNLADGSYAKLSQADGLASNRVNDLLVDAEGVLWIATDAGINRYDGQTFTTYGEADGLDAQWIQTLFLDDTGVLWAGSRGGERGLNYYDGESWGPPPIPSLPVEFPNVQALCGNTERGFFVGVEDQGVAQFDGNAWSLLTSADGLPSDQVLDALLTDDALWVSFDLALVRFDRVTGDREIFQETNIHTMHQTAGGELWFGGEWRALRFDPGTGDWQRFETAPGPIPARLVTDIAESKEGLWFGTYGGGVAFYDGNRWETYATDEELGGNWIEAIRQGKDGVIWFSHPGSGLSRYDSESDAWQVFGEDEGALDWPCVPGVDSEGNLWIGESGELLRYDGQAWQRFTAPELTDVEIYAIEIGPGDVKWLVTDRGLLRHDPASDEWTTFTGANFPIIEGRWSVLAASDGTFWFSGGERLVRYDGNAWSSPVAAGDAPQLVDDLVESPDGSLWVAADGELWHLADGRWSHVAWPLGWLERVAVGPDGSVWVGYEGLGRYDPASGDWQSFMPADGLVHLLVHDIEVTPAGVVWVGTGSGVSRYVPPD
jgi:serine/threonine protein kinase/ligand-binding sensor domain-containing protein